MTARIVNHYVGLTDVEVTLMNTSDHGLSIVVGIIRNKKLPAAGLDTRSLPPSNPSKALC
jgi:hypothetical protein